MIGSRSISAMVLIGTGLLAIAASTACTQIVPTNLLGSAESGSPQSLAQPAPATAGTSTTSAPPAASGKAGGPRLATVKRDSITQVMTLDGQVVARDQVPITFAGRGVVQDVKVKAGQAVKQGDVLLELDSVEISRALSVARARAQTSQANLAQAQGQSLARSRTAAQRADADRIQQQQAVTDAQVGLRRAQDNMARVQAGASDSDRRAAQNALDAASSALQKAQAAQNKVSAGPDQDLLRTVQREVATDQIALKKAQTDLATLLRGAEPIVVREAQGNVDRAETQLQLAQAARLDPRAPDQNTAQLQHDAAISQAQLALQLAQDHLQRIKQPPADTDVQSARQHAQDAQDTLDAATSRLATFEAGPDQMALDAAQAAVDVAQQNVDQAQARLDEVNSHPTRAELADAQDQVRRAQVALQNAQRTPASQADDPGGVDLTALQEAVDQDQSDVASLEQQLQNTFVTAPFDGTVVAVRARPGVFITSANPVVVLAKPGTPIIHVELADDQTSQLAAGQHATVQLDVDNAPAPINATLAVVRPAAKDGSTGPSADFDVQWPDAQTPRFGLPVVATVSVSQKSGVLVVPRTAIHRSGDRTYVELMNGSLRRLVDVQVGITTADAAEIVSGVSEGQVVLAGPS